MAMLDAWWFAESDTLPHDDGRRIVIGETLKVEPPIIPCKRGLHASLDPFDALQYAPGPLLYRVRLGGEIVAHGSDKHVASERTALGCHDATEMLRLFARKMAARDAAWDDARTAAWEAARKLFNEMVEELFA